MSVPPWLANSRTMGAFWFSTTTPVATPLPVASAAIGLLAATVEIVWPVENMPVPWLIKVTSLLSTPSATTMWAFPSLFRFVTTKASMSASVPLNPGAGRAEIHDLFTLVNVPLPFPLKISSVPSATLLTIRSIWPVPRSAACT